MKLEVFCSIMSFVFRRMSKGEGKKKLLFFLIWSTSLEQCTSSLPTFFSFYFYVTISLLNMDTIDE